MTTRISRLCVEAVLRGSDADGGITTYYQSQKSWEGRMRNQFRDLVTARASTGSFASAADLLRALNAFYRTRYPVAHLSVVASSVECAVRDVGWWDATPPSLLGATSAESEAIADVAQRSIADVNAATKTHPYSLTTKFLHFCFPETFPIYDAQAAASIHMWSYFAFEDRGSTWRRFSYGATTWTDASGYGGIVDFYRQFWEAAGNESRDALRTSAERMSNEIGGRVTVIDLVDKLVWMANGDPRRLGLLGAFLA